MPSSPLDEFTAGLQPADILTLFAGLRNTIPVYAALGATGTNEGHDEELARRQGPRTIDAPRPLSPDEVNRRAMQDFEAQYPDPQFRQMLINAMLRERGNPYSATTATRRRDFEEAPATARHSMQATPRKYANGGAIDFSVPDMADGGRFIPDAQPFNKGGSAKKFQAGGIAKGMAKSLRTSTAKAREIAGGDLFHGGDIKRGDVIRRPLFMTPNLEMAQSYADFKDFGRTVQKFNPPIKKPAPERLVNAAARRYVPENAELGYTPASAFDDNLHDPDQIAALIRELERRGYDAAVATDIGMGGLGAVEAPAVVRFPGQRAFNKGGSAKKTLDEMAAEMMRKGVKVADKPDLSRRSFFGFGKGSDFPLAKMDTKALETLGKDAPAITEKSVTIDPGKGAAKSTLKSVSETPVSRREVLKSAAGQMLRGVLPDLGGLSSLGNVAKVAESMAPAAVSADMAPGLIMAAIKRGMSEEEAVKFVRGQLSGAPPTKAFNINDPNHVQLEAMYKHLSDPEWAPNEWEFFGPMRPSGALNVMLHTPNADVSPLQLRGALRQIKEADPKRYQQLINASKDFSMSTGETAVEMGMISPQDLAKYMKGEHAQPNIRPENLWNE